MSNGSAESADGQMHTQTDGTGSITSTADAGGNNCNSKVLLEQSQVLFLESSQTSFTQIWNDYKLSEASCIIPSLYCQEISGFWSHLPHSNIKIYDCNYPKHSQTQLHVSLISEAKFNKQAFTVQ